MPGIMRSLAPSGTLGVQVLRRPSVPRTVGQALQQGLPRPGLSLAVFAYRVRNLPNLLRGAWKLWLAERLHIPHFYGVVTAMVRRASGGIEELGTLSLRVVTDNGVAFIVDAFDNTVELEIMNYHGCGTGTNAEGQTDTALQTESTTALNPDSTRATGTQSQPSANIYRSVGTLTFDASAAVTEHGLFSTSGTGTGVLLDRSVFSAVNVASGDSIQFTYSLTLTAGS